MGRGAGEDGGGVVAGGGLAEAIVLDQRLLGDVLRRVVLDDAVLIAILDDLGEGCRWDGGGDHRRIVLMRGVVLEAGQAVVLYILLVRTRIL